MRSCVHGTYLPGSLQACVLRPLFFWNLSWFFMSDWQRLPVEALQLSFVEISNFQLVSHQFSRQEFSHRITTKNRRKFWEISPWFFWEIRSLNLLYLLRWWPRGTPVYLYPTVLMTSSHVIHFPEKAPRNFREFSAKFLTEFIWPLYDILSFGSCEKMMRPYHDDFDHDLYNVSCRRRQDELRTGVEAGGGRSEEGSSICTWKSMRCSIVRVYIS